MTKSEHKTPRDVASTLSGIASQIASAALNKDVRYKLQKRSERCPDALVEMVIFMLDIGGFDVGVDPFVGDEFGLIFWVGSLEFDGNRIMAVNKAPKPW